MTVFCSACQTDVAWLGPRRDKRALSRNSVLEIELNEQARGRKPYSQDLFKNWPEKNLQKYLEASDNGDFSYLLQSQIAYRMDLHTLAFTILG